MATKHQHQSTRITGNEEVSGMDPGGTRSTRPGHRAPGVDGHPEGEPTISHEVESGDRNVNPDLMQRLPHGEVVTEMAGAPADTKGRTMSASNETLQDLYVTGLRNAYAMETQAMELISRQLDRLADYPEMEARLRRHLKESEEQRGRAEEALQQLNESHSSLKSAAMGLLGNLAALGHVPAPDEVLKNTLANFAFEHYEMAAYKSLIALGEAMNQAPGLTGLKQSLSEEEAMAQWIDAHIGPTTLTFAERKAAGAKADR